MSKISAMLDIGKRSLSNSGTGLQVVGHNIANKSTEGFSRQRVELQTAVPISEGRIQIGMGARTGQVSRTNNPWLEKQIQRETTNMGSMETKSDSLARVEQVYNEQINKGLNQYMTDFFNSFRELSNNPESLAARTMVRETAVAMANDFKRVNTQLRDIQIDLDNQLKTNVEEINQMAKEIASLNEKIQIVENQGAHANDERDRRDVLLKQMGERVDITWGEGANGDITVTAGRTAIMVSGGSYNELKTAGSATTDKVEVYFKSGEHASLHNVTQQLTGGKIGGALQVRDQSIEEMRTAIDKMAYKMAEQINTAHIEGFDRAGRAGVLFFEMPESENGASDNLALNTTIFNDVGRIAAASRPNAPGDNLVANVISSLQYQRLMDGGTATFDDFYNTQVGQIGTIAQRANKTFEAQKNIISQLGNIRESISGVSLDEETTKMIEFQRAYEASARLIRTADEMLETVINLKRL
jgi:flagellar hook-associated protein 1 FlgK